MKDIVISKKNQVLALWLLAGSLVAAVGVNAGAIIAYNRPWTELFTQVGFTICVAAVLWMFSLLIWGIVALVKKII